MEAHSQDWVSTAKIVTSLDLIAVNQHLTRNRIKLYLLKRNIPSKRAALDEIAAASALGIAVCATCLLATSVYWPALVCGFLIAICVTAFGGDAAKYVRYKISRAAADQAEIQKLQAEIARLDDERQDLLWLVGGER